MAVDLPCDPRAPAIVRDTLAEAHDGSWPLQDGLLVASELVSNAVRHSGCTASHRLRVTAGLRNGRLMISVLDPGLSGGSARPALREDSEPGGWGLRIIEQLSERWGSERPDGYRVWAELPALT